MKLPPLPGLDLAPQPKFKPTPEQAFCIEQFATGRALKISAYAGTGKTSTLIQLAESTNRGGVYLAFNKSIAAEARRRFPRSVTCSTTHAMAFRAMRPQYSPEKMTDNVNGGFLAMKLNIHPRAINDELLLKPRQWGFLLCETVKRWQRSDRDAITEVDVPIQGKLATLSLDERATIRKQLAKEAAVLWEKMIDPRSALPLGHDGYLKLWALGRPTILGDYILLDEAQDTNGVVMGLMRHQSAQLVAVGDRWQQIYEWRGARNAMTELPSELEARLSTSFRFGPGIAGYATRILTLLGESVPLQGNPARPSEIGPVARPDAILCRTNGRLLDELIGAIGAGRRPYVVGGTSEMLTYVDAAAKLMGGQAVEQPLDFFGFQDWREVQDAAKTEEGADLRRWVNIIDAHSPARLRHILKSLPEQENAADLVLSTGHKAKGREWDSVRLTDDFLQGVRIDDEESAGMTDALAAELRLFYVAATRGKDALDVPGPLRAKLDLLEKEAGMTPAAEAPSAPIVVETESTPDEPETPPAGPEPTSKPTRKRSPKRPALPGGYDELIRAFEFFNDKLFGGHLPPTMIVPRVRDAKKAYGLFLPERWANADGQAFHEIGMNAETFRTRSPEETLSTLVHEMVHLQHQLVGKPSRNGYHNEEWAGLMDMVGLTPSDTAAPGGKRTGQKVSHYIVKGGPFDRACAKLLATGFQIPWYDRMGEFSGVGKAGKGGSEGEGEGLGGEGLEGEEGAAPKKSRSGVKLKYTCPGCEANAWGKPDLSLICGKCNMHYLGSHIEEAA